MMNNVVIPEITPEINKIKEALQKDLSCNCKFKIPLLHKKCLRVVKSFGIVTEVHLTPKKITVYNGGYIYITVGILFFLPLGIYCLIKMKDNETLRSEVQDIVFRATRK